MSTIDSFEIEQSGFHRKYVGFYDALKLVIEGARRSGKRNLTFEEIQCAMAMHFTIEGGFEFRSLDYTRLKILLAPTQLAKSLKGIQPTSLGISF